MENLFPILGVIGGLFGAWVVVKIAIAKLKTEVDTLKRDNDTERKLTDKQITSLEISTEKAIDKVEEDYKKAIERVEAIQKEHREQVGSNFKVLFKKMEDDKETIVSKLMEITKEISELKGKLDR